MSNLTSAEWAAWVQAAGSIIAIGVAVWVTQRQHKSALDLFHRERRHADLALARTLAKLAKNCSTYIASSIERVNDPRKLYLVATGEQPLDVPAFKYMERAISDIPLHGLPETLVTYPVTLVLTIRQFGERVEKALELGRRQRMRERDYQELFQTFDEMRASLNSTVTLIEQQILVLEREAQ